MNDYKAPDKSQDAHQKPVLCAGVNVGFGWTKIATQNSLMLWPSVVSDYQPGLQTNREVEPGMLVALAGQSYEVGEGAAKFGIPLKALHRNFAQTDVYKAMVHAVLQRLSQSGVQWSVVVGVALNHYRDAAVRESVRALWQGSDGFHRLSNGQLIRINAVRVIPETFGAAAELMADAERAHVWSQSKVMILDFGRFTTGWVPLTNGQAGSGTDSIDVGVSVLIERLTSKLRAVTGVPSLTESEVELAMVGRKTLYGQATGGKRSQVDINPFLETAINETWPQIEAQLRSKLGDLRGLDVVAIGGGANVFMNKLKTTFGETNLLIPENAQDINALGMLRLATSHTLPTT